MRDQTGGKFTMRSAKKRFEK